jgi:hypothetical protein
VVSDEQPGLYTMFLINTVAFNIAYIIYACLNYSFLDVVMSQSVNVVLHYFFLTSFGLILAMTVFRTYQMYAPIGIPKTYTLVSSLLVYGKKQTAALSLIHSKSLKPRSGVEHVRLDGCKKCFEQTSVNFDIEQN